MSKNGLELDTILGVAAALSENAEARVPLWAELDKDGNPVPGAQPPGSIAIYADKWPEESNSVTVTDYPVADDPSLSDSTIGVQFTIWHRDLGDLRRICDDLFDYLHGRWGGKLGNVTLVNAVLQSGANIGQDGNGRVGRTRNYYLQVHRPSPNRQ